MWNAGLDVAQVEIKFARRNINNLRYADDTLMAESEKELKRASWWMWKRRVEKLLKRNIQKMKIMESDPITSWQIDEETMETMTDFIFLGSKITADGDCSHEIKRHLLLGRKAMTNLDSILKRRDITLLTKVHIIKAMVFPVVMQGYESWTIKKAEHWRIDAFELWCWTRIKCLLDNKEIKLVHPKGNQSWIFIARTDAEALILSPPDAKNWLIGKDPDKDWRQEEKGTTEDDMVGRHHQLDGHECEPVLGVGDWQGSLACCSPQCCKELDTTERLNWTESLGKEKPQSSQDTIRFKKRQCFFGSMFDIFHIFQEGPILI